MKIVKAFVKGYIVSDALIGRIVRKIKLQFQLYAPVSLAMLSIKHYKMPRLFTAFFLMLFACINKPFAQNCSEANSLLSVTTSKTGRTEYVIFTIKNPTNVTPVVTNATPPFIQDGSGNTINVTGCKYKKITLNNVVWTCTVANNISSNKYLLQQVKNIGQFEGQINYIVGYRCNAKSIVSYSYNQGSLKKWVLRLKY